MDQIPAANFSREQFIQSLQSSGVLSEDEIAPVLAKWPAGLDTHREAMELAKEFIRLDLLTAYQAKVILNGMPHPLVYDNYVVTDRLGQGGMGLVLRVRHRLLKQDGALKVVSTSAKERSPRALDRFRREMDIVSRLSHPNVVRALYGGVANDSLFFVTEFVDGIDLKRRVKEQGPMPVTEAIDCMIQAARGLAHAHANNVVHRDIKPGNLLLDKRGVVRVLDFGLARGEDGDAAQNLTQASTVLGTMDYISPEQVANTHLVDQRSDIYSLGCTLFYLLTGRTPYTGNSPVAKMLAHRQQPIPSLTAVRPEVSPAIDQAFQKMMAKKVEDRFQTMDGLIGGLTEALHAPVEPPVVATKSAANDTASIEADDAQSSDQRPFWSRLLDAIHFPADRKQRLYWIAYLVVAVDVVMLVAYLLTRFFVAQ